MSYLVIDQFYPIINDKNMRYYINYFVFSKICPKLSFFEKFHGLLKFYLRSVDVR